MITSRKEDLLRYESDLQSIQETSDIKKLKKYKKLRESSSPDTGSVASSAYHHYLFQGYEVLAGKNNRTNDQLTFQSAHKNDLWLHVKDAPGSHVIIRHKSGQNFPAQVVEYGASIAALYSKRKHEKICPVSYTLRKYVRKGKGLKPGEVIVEREQVVLVSPLHERAKK
jgi:predicted ribosome quality control (RQC) complex YloA/Tae2 family protein